MKSAITVSIGQSHKAPSVEVIQKAFNTTGKSALIPMAINPALRPRVERYRDDAVWQALHCSERGAEHEKEAWMRVAEHISAVLAGTSALHEARSRKVGRWK
jgi:hypothetical protein